MLCSVVTGGSMLKALVVAMAAVVLAGCASVAHVPTHDQLHLDASLECIEVYNGDLDDGR
jgi:hypothetical protein